MTGWEDVRLGDVADTLVGFPFKSAGFTDDSSGVRLLRGVNIGQGFLDWSRTAYWPADDVEKYGRFQLLDGDVVLAMDRPWIEAGLKRARVGNGTLPALLVQRVTRLRGTEQIRTSFIHHLLASPSFADYIRPIVTGVNVPHISPGQIAAYRFQLPSLGEQDAICAVLDSLDDLIENNRRRIGLLEQIAQAIYREWFVHFRYPGHEEDELVDSHLGPIPAGWSAARLGDVIELRYGKALKASARKDGPVAVVGSSGVVGWHNESVVSGPAVVVGRKGNVGSVIWIQGESWPIDTTYYVTTDLPLHFVYRMLRQIEFIDSHAAVPGLSRDQAYSTDVLRPDIEVAALFEDIASELSAIGSVLERQAAVLSRVRDALLPKLVTGAIDVSNLDLDALLEETAA